MICSSYSAAEESPCSYLLERIAPRAATRVLMGQRKIIFSRASYFEGLAFRVMMCSCTGRVTSLGFALCFPHCCSSVSSPGGILADVTQEAVGCSCFQIGGHLQPPLRAASCLYNSNDLSQSRRLRSLLMDAEAF